MMNLICWKTGGAARSFLSCMVRVVVIRLSIVCRVPVRPRDGPLPLDSRLSVSVVGRRFAVFAVFRRTIAAGCLLNWVVVVRSADGAGDVATGRQARVSKLN
jgi:hypothetical protein